MVGTFPPTKFWDIMLSTNQVIIVHVYTSMQISSHLLHNSFLENAFLIFLSSASKIGWVDRKRTTFKKKMKRRNEMWEVTELWAKSL